MKTKQRRWVVFNNGCIHGIQHSEVTVIRTGPGRSVSQDSIAIFTLSKMFSAIAALAVLTVLVLLLVGCQTARPQRGGSATSSITHPGHTNLVTLTQSENPSQPSRQTVQSEQTVECVLPAGTAVGLGLRTEVGGRGSGIGGQRSAGKGRSAEDGSQPSQTPQLLNSQTLQLLTPNSYLLSQPMPLRCVIKDRTETSIGGAQKDTARDLAAKAARMQPVMWAGIVMMTIVAGLLVYFGWWTKAAVALVVGLAMLVLAATLPDHGTLILLGGLGVFAFVALLVLYAYYSFSMRKLK